MRIIYSLLFLAALAAPAVADSPHVGDRVWAEWRPNSWASGRIDRSCPSGLHVRFDDGYQLCQNLSRIAVDRMPRFVGEGARVVARWKNGRWYPGRVISRPNGLYTVRFDDGDLRTVDITALRTIGR